VDSKRSDKVREAIVPTVKERIAQIYANSTPEGQALLTKYADALLDPNLLVALESASKPLSRGDILNALVEATRRQQLH